MEPLIQDVRYAWRMLIKNPGFTLVASLVLMLGIGANTAVFSLVNTLLFKPLSVERPAELARLYSRDRKPEGGFRAFSYPNYADIRDKNTAFASLAAFSVAMTGVQEGDATRRVFAATVTANYLATFGVRPVLGRDFLPEEERPGSAVPVAIVSHQYWRRHGSDPGLVGRTLVLNGRSFNVVGVAPEGFSGTSVMFSPDLWLPLGVHELVVNAFQRQQGRSLGERDNPALMVFGRLKPGVRLADAEAQLRPLADQLEQAYPGENKGQTLVVGPLSRVSIGTGPSQDREGKAMALLLMPMAAVVLLTACLNLANMLLARSATRRKEVAIRVALGGSRRRVLRLLLTEGLLLAALGGGLALLVAYWSTHLLVHSLGPKIPFMTIVFDARPDLRVLAATFGFAVLATVLFAFVPAWRACRADVVEDLKAQTGQGRGGRRVMGFLSPRNLLVTGQLALSFVLLAVAGLFVRGARNANAADPGFRFEQGLLLELDSSLAGYDETKSRAVYRDLLDRVRALPGVESVSLASMVPFGLFGDSRDVEQAGARNDAANGAGKKSAEKPVSASYVIVGTDYFKTLGLPLLRGREFDRLEVEGGGSGRVVVLDELLAKRLWPDQEALGRQVQFHEGDPAKQPVVMTVVGVAPALKQDLGDKEPSPHVYVPLGQDFQSQMNFHVRLASRDPVAETALLRTVRAEIRAVDATLPVLSANTLRDFHSDGLMMWFYRAGARLFVTFAGLAVFLAVVGVYGVKAFVVARRTRELGIRLALGATHGQVLWLVLRDGLQLTAAGLGLGLLVALGVGRLLSSKLYEVSGTDPVTFGGALLVLTGAAVLASYLPALRATRIDPMAALRCE
jgi:predicted permease